MTSRGRRSKENGKTCQFKKKRLMTEAEAKALVEHLFETEARVVNAFPCKREDYCRLPDKSKAWHTGRPSWWWRGKPLQR